MSIQLLRDDWKHLDNKVEKYERQLRMKFFESKLDRKTIEKKIRDSINRKFREENCRLIVKQCQLVANLHNV